MPWFLSARFIQEAIYVYSEYISVLTFSAFLPDGFKRYPTRHSMQCTCLRTVTQLTRYPVNLHHGNWPLFPVAHVNALVHRYYTSNPFNVTLFLLHIQVYWRFCCISKHNQRTQSNFKWKVITDKLARGLISPWQPQNGRSLSWGTDLCSCNNKVDPSASKDLCRIANYSTFLTTTEDTTTTRLWMQVLSSSPVDASYDKLLLTDKVVRTFISPCIDLATSRR